MKDLLKMMFIPIVGCIAIGVMFLLVIFGGFWEEDVYNQEGTLLGDASREIPFATDGTITFTGECDGNTYRPVCGEDGETYDNACYAVKAGTRAIHLGQCGSRQ